MEILKFYADWCSPCKAVAPIVEAVASKHGIPVHNINIDSEQELVEKYKVRGVPTVMFVKDGEVLSTKVGQFTAEQFEGFVKCLKE